MPYMQAMTSGANIKFMKGNAASTLAEVINRQLLRPGDRLGDSADSLGLAMSPEAVAFLNTAPPGIAEAIRAAVASALTRSLSITWAWMPAYDWELMITESQGTKDSDGGMTILVKSRYPGDDFREGVQPRPA